MENKDMPLLPTDRGMARLFRVVTGSPAVPVIVARPAGSDYCDRHHCVKDDANLCPLCKVDARHNQFVSAREVADIIAHESAIRAAERGCL